MDTILRNANSNDKNKCKKARKYSVLMREKRVSCTNNRHYAHFITNFIRLFVLCINLLFPLYHVDMMLSMLLLLLLFFHGGIQCIRYIHSFVLQRMLILIRTQTRTIEPCNAAFHIRTYAHIYTIQKFAFRQIYFILATAILVSPISRV